MIKSLLAATMVITIIVATPAYAGQWMRDTNGWWWQNDDGSYVKNRSEWLDGNNDGVSECYYFDENGYLLTNGVAPDGNQVNVDGAWTLNGILQTQLTDSNSPEWNADNGWEVVCEVMIPDGGDWNTSASGTKQSEEDATDGIEEIDAYELSCRILELVNEERIKKGKEALTINDELMQIAEIRAEESDYCAPHERPDGSRYSTAVPFSDYVGENLANMTCGYRDLDKTAQDAVDGWMNSSGHKKNILNSRYTQTGVGVFIEGSRMCVIQLFINN